MSTNARACLSYLAPLALAKHALSTLKEAASTNERTDRQTDRHPPYNVCMKMWTRAGFPMTKLT